jgi:outer membrane receptor for ferrienterochelin and colicin
MKFARYLICTLAVIAFVMPAGAQLPTGTLTGHVDDGKAPLPGVSVTVTSANLQGVRTATTSVNGDYIFTFLPPGDYNVRFELQGFQTVETGIKISAAQGATVNATMPAGKVAEEVTVTGSYETISTTSQAASTLTNDLLNKLPVAASAGTIANYAALAAGTNVSAVTGNIAISGGLSYENLFLVNGVAIMDNIRNTPTNFYVEDAVQETTTSTAGISAEYGRFAGGVVNMLTKSGGNEFHGSLRLGLDDDKWTAPTPLTVTRTDKINDTWSATLGGFILKDRLWFFGAYRYRKTDLTQQTSYTNLPYPVSTTDKRYEGKLTFSITSDHRLVGSYLDYDVL